MKNKILMLLLLFIPMSYAKSFNLQNHIQDLEELGVTVVPNVYTPEQIQQFQSELSPIVQKVQAVMKTKGNPRVFHNDGKTTKTKYWKLGQNVVLQAGEGRFDTRYGLNHGTFAKTHFQHNPKIEQIIKKVLHSRYVNHTGVVYSAPGSSDQYWHRDTDNIADSDSDGTKLVSMDDFYFTVLIPLVPMSTENGTTEFMLGTHRKNASNFDSATKKQFDLKLGDVLVFNGKINHRGRANNSKNERPVLYNVYYKGWYNDTYREGVI